MDIGAKRKMVEEYIRLHPECTYRDIRKATKIKIERVFGNMRQAYTSAGIPFSNNLTKRDNERQKQDVVEYVKNHRGCTVTEIQKNTGVCIPRVFGSILTAYRDAGVSYPTKEITSGVRNPVVVRRCRDYELQAIQTLKLLGKVLRHVRTRAGVVDCILVTKDDEFVVEVKDFRSRNNITMSQIKQLLRYLSALNINTGLLVCPKESFPVRKNSRDILLNGKNIKILSLDDIVEMIRTKALNGNAGI